MCDLGSACCDQMVEEHTPKQFGVVVRARRLAKSNEFTAASTSGWLQVACLMLVLCGQWRRTTLAPPKRGQSEDA